MPCWLEQYLCLAINSAIINCAAPPPPTLPINDCCGNGRYDSSGIEKNYDNIQLKNSDTNDKFCVF